MSTPGAKTSTQLPKLEKDARKSLSSLAPTTSASVTSAGEPVQALTLLLPAAMEYVMPAAMEFFTAVSTAVLMNWSKPRLMFATAGFWALAVTQSMPPTTLASVPLPVQSSNFTATSWICLATPTLLPPMVPATWVPCPKQSSLIVSIVLVPNVARPPNCSWVTRIPVSMTYACTFDAVFGKV